MQNIITGRLYLEDKEMLTIIKEKNVSILGINFLCNNFRVIKRSFYIKDGLKIPNILYHYDIYNNTNFENYIVKDEVEDIIERYVKKCEYLVDIKYD